MAEISQSALFMKCIKYEFLPLSKCGLYQYVNDFKVALAQKPAKFDNSVCPEKF